MTTFKSKAPDAVGFEVHKRLLQQSRKFIDWKLEEMSAEDALRLHVAIEKHFTPQELADVWGVSVQTIREIFKGEDGVLKIGSNGTRTRRAYKTLRIPESVAERVHTRLSA